ncbi:LacI family DNA-binding transcriptional regulator [Herbiconiux sp. UC225_62]|uniref:LacI family DNA-binding transcriptional regulator n=1 Tax=Herbiconiux sp. UC225_62 TaxID=3350168 RepID=UPI0036D32CCA
MSQTTGSGRVTIADIAELAGVSVPTVSKVLNGKPGVSDNTRLRVSAMLREHEYEPRRSTASHVIELVLGELTSPWSTALVVAVEEAAFERGLAVVLSRIRPGDDTWLEGIASRSGDGVVFAVVRPEGEQKRRFEETGLPAVVIDPGDASDSGSMATVGVTHWRGAYTATEHLLRLGHRRLAMIAGPNDVLFSRARADGFRAAALASGVDMTADRLIFAEFGYDAGLEAGLQLLRAPERPTAIFAASDEQALGVYEAARQCDVRIPADLSVVGFNDVPIAQWAAPPLTTVREPILDMARHALDVLLTIAAGRPPGPVVEIATELVVRQSTAAPPAER